MVTCPTCGASGSEMCVRGRKPNGSAGVTGAVWMKKIPFPEGHDSRRTAQTLADSKATVEDYAQADVEYLMDLTNAIGARVAAGDLHPQDAYGRYLV